MKNNKMAAVQELVERVKADKVYIDTDVGKDDDSADGTEAQPYKTLGHAFVKNMDQAARQFLVRASETGAAGPDGDVSARLAWKEPAKSAVKKAQGVLDSHRKKAQKQQQAAGKEEEQRRQRLKNLDEARKITLTEDASLPAAQTIKLWRKDVELGGDDGAKGARVRVFGRIHRLRPQKHATSSRSRTATASCSACWRPGGSRRRSTP